MDLVEIGKVIANLGATGVAVVWALKAELRAAAAEEKLIQLLEKFAERLLDEAKR